jgi:hypothetical protein
MEVKPALGVGVVHNGFSMKEPVDWFSEGSDRKT